MTDAAPAEVEMAEVEARDEICCGSKSNPNLCTEQKNTRTVVEKVSDAVD